MRSIVIAAAIVSAALLVFTSAEPAYAYTNTGTITSGGGRENSATYENFGTIGLLSGDGSSDNYRNLAGFIQVVGAEGALYPIIGATPGSFTFTMIIGTAPANQNLSITNKGGSTLAWNTAKSQVWLTLTPGTGTNAGTVIVGIDTAGLIAGNYQNTITISGTGADPITIPVSLTVNPSQLPLLSVNIAGSGSGTVNSSPTGIGSPRDIVCTTGSSADCSARYATGTVVTLLQTASSYSTFTGWSGDCSGTAACSVSMNGPRNVTAAFTANPATVRIFYGYKNYYFYVLRPVFDMVRTGSYEVYARDVVFTENVIITSRAGFKLKGGYTNDAFTTRDANSYTIIDGTLKIRGGGLKVDRVKVR